MLRLILTVLLLATPAIAATPVEFNGLHFDQPDGWTRNTQSRPGLYMLQRQIPGDERGRGKGSAIIQISSPIPASEGSFDDVFARLLQAVPELAKERPLQHGKGVTVNGHRIAYDVRCCARRNDASIDGQTVGISDGQRHYILMLLTINTRGDTEKQLRADFAALVRSFRPHETDRPFELVPPPDTGGLEGVYTHLRTGLRPNAFGGMAFFSDSEILVFDRGGLFSRDLPRGEQSMADYCRAQPQECGLYRVVGDRIQMLDANADFGVLEPRDEPLRRDGEDLRIGDEAQRHVPPFPPGARLQGAWRYFFAQVGTTAFSSNSVAVERTLVLTADGRFRRTGFVGTSSSNDVGSGTTGVTTSSRRPLESGRYELEGYRLVLVGDDGQRETHSIFRPDINSDGLLVINGSNYLRQEPK